jgi:hypothetical protein
MKTMAQLVVAATLAAAASIIPITPPPPRSKAPAPTPRTSRALISLARADGATASAPTSHRAPPTAVSLFHV